MVLGFIQEYFKSSLQVRTNLSKYYCIKILPRFKNRLLSSHLIHPFIFFPHKVQLTKTLLQFIYGKISTKYKCFNQSISFLNNSFFDNINTFKTKRIGLVGVSLPNFQYGFSFQPNDKIKLAQPTKINIIRQFSRKKSSKNKPKLNINFTKRKKNNFRPKHNIRRLKRKTSLRKHRKSIYLLRNRTKRLGTKNNMKSVRCFFSKHTFFPFKKRRYLNFRYFKKFLILYYRRSRFFKHYNTLYPRKTKLDTGLSRLVLKKIKKNDTFTKFKKSERMFKKVRNTLRSNIYSRRKKRIFTNIKNHIYFQKKYRNIRRKIKISLYKILKLKLKNLNKVSQAFNIYSKNLKSSKGYRDITVSKPLGKFSKSLMKWKHQKPFLFLGYKVLRKNNCISIVESHINFFLTKYLFRKKRTKRAQSFLKKNNFLGPGFFKNSSKIKLQKLYNPSFRILSLVPNKTTHDPFLSKTTLVPKLIFNFKKLTLNRLRMLQPPTNFLNVTSSIGYTNKKSSSKNKKSPQNPYIRRVSIISHKVLTKSRLFNLYPISHSPKLVLKPKTQALKINTRVNQPFILKSFLLFFTKLRKNLSFQYKISKFSFKKLFFSFFKLNEVRQSLIDSKKRFFFYKILFQQRFFLKKQSNYSFKPFKLKQLYHVLLKKTSDHKPSTLETALISRDLFDLRKIDFGSKRMEIRIPRVRFKPGYQRIWRQSRKALQEVLGTKFIYQKKLSRYITRFFKKTNYFAFSTSEMSISTTIIYSRLVPDISTLLIFLNQHLIYINGQNIYSLKKIVYENDIIQLITSKWYYAAYRWVANWTLKRIKRYKKLIYRKGLSGKYKLMKQKKQRSFYVPQWIYLTQYDTADIKPYLEVDYLTLSAIVIYNPYIMNYHMPLETTYYRPNIYRLYNWKYIT